MGHVCWMCGRSRPNEAFSGKNHGRHLCRECARLPRETRERARRRDALWGMLFQQSVISPKNIGMAYEWAGSEDADIAGLAKIVVDVGRAHPGRKKRWPRIRTLHPELWSRLVAAGVADQLPMDSSREDRPGDDRLYEGTDDPEPYDTARVDDVQKVSPTCEEDVRDEIPF